MASTQVELERLTAELETAQHLNWLAQRFFASLVEETSRPHYGDHAKSVLQVVVARAQAEGIYQPSKAQ